MRQFGSAVRINFGYGERAGPAGLEFSRLDLKAGIKEQDLITNIKDASLSRNWHASEPRMLYVLTLRNLLETSVGNLHLTAPLRVGSSDSKVARIAHNLEGLVPVEKSLINLRRNSMPEKNSDPLDGGCVRHVEKELPKTNKSSMKTSMVYSIISWKIAIIHRWNMPGALQSPKGMRLYANIPYEQVNVVFSWSFRSMGISK
nr:hypothetical protein [Tanacetum cinerariifolium]